MRPIGYLYKRVAAAPAWPGPPHIRDVYALSACMSANFADYIRFWRHNGYWLFDSPAIMQALAREQDISLDGLTLFYYEAHDLEYDETNGEWSPFEPVPSFTTDVERPVTASLEGFDVVSFSLGTSPGCSPLSCNSLATSIATNAHCLLPTFDDAVRALETGQFTTCEPGPYRIIAVYSVDGSA
jgi:hypothetical protein